MKMVTLVYVQLNFYKLKLLSQGMPPNESGDVSETLSNELNEAIKPHMGLIQVS